MTRAFVPYLILSCYACSPPNEQVATMASKPSGSLHFPQGNTHRVMAFDITQETCALYVALRSHALDESISFGRDLADTKVHWNMCPGGSMVACSVAPGAKGVPVITGIPWPYAPPVRH